MIVPRVQTKDLKKETGVASKSSKESEGSTDSKTDLDTDLKKWVT